MRRPVVLIALAALLIPSVTHAGSPGLVRAVTINTPGQSGHISTVDFALRTAGEDMPFGPHMTDQLPLYTALKYKPGEFRTESGVPDAVAGGARIYRDAYGVPAVFGDTNEQAWYGVGYALAQDRMWQMHLLRMVAEGRLSELVGNDGVEMDLQIRRDYYTPRELDEFFAQLQPWEQQQLASYSAGINQYIAEMHADPNKMPAEIAALGLPIAPWTPMDSFALGTLVARNVASDGGQELENAKLLRDLVAAHGGANGKAIFDDLLWSNDPGAPTSVPASAGAFPSYPDGPPQADALDRSLDFVASLPASSLNVARLLERERDLRSRLQHSIGLPRGGSNVWAISPARSANGHTFLFNGPQVGYNVAGLLSEFEIHAASPRLDAKGITVAGVPVVGIGYTPTHAWGLTSGLSDTIDLYVEKLAGDAHHYVYNGETRAMECRTDVMLVKSTLEVLDATPPHAESHEFCRTVHGPVIAIDEANGVAYSHRFAIFGAELGTLKGILAFPYAADLAAFTNAMSMVTWNENTTYADAGGHIAYWHPGLYPSRPRAYDERLPYPGTGEAEWKGLLTFEQMPHVADPERGWVANWNSKPSTGWTSGDPHYSDRPWGTANRLDMIGSVLGGAVTIGDMAPIGPDGLVDGRTGIFAPDVNAGLYDLSRSYFVPFLQAAANDPSATQDDKDAIAAILAWDGNHMDEDADGKVDAAGNTIFDAWVEAAAKRFFGQYLTVGGFSRGGHKFDPSPVINLFLRALQGVSAPLPQSRDYLGGLTSSRAVLSSLDDTIAQLRAQFGNAPMSAWLRPAYTSSLEPQGLGPEGTFPFQDRGSWIEAVEFAP